MPIVPAARSISMKRGDIRIGISGWTYAGWRGRFYPDDLPQRRELEYAASKFRSIEINGSHYSLQRPEYFQQWYDATPDDFVFAVKGSRYITHMRRLRDIETALANFFAQGLLKLNEKLGPILWQFPPRFVYRRERLEPFFELLPRTMREAAKLARKHDERLEGRAWTKADGDRAVRHAIETRHDSFCDPDLIRLLRRRKIARVVADTVDWPLLMDVTTDFIYCRLHGSKQLYSSGYGPKALDTWAKRVLAWSKGRDAPDGKRVGTPAPKRASRDVFVYFDNDAKVRAPFDALALEKCVAA